MAGLVLLQPPLIRADPVVEVGPEDTTAAGAVVEVGPEDTTAASAVEDENRGLWTFPFLITFGVHGGYDSNPNTTRNGSGSGFTDEQLTLAYDRLRGSLDLKTLAALGVVERFDGETDVNTSLDFSLSYHASPRLTLGATVNAVYTSEPSFAANVGPTQRAGNYFATTDGLSAAYQWLPRFTTVSTYSFSLVRYQNGSTAAFSDRQENTLGEEFRFDLWRDTVLVADYRFLLVNYVTNPLDSTTNFALAGVEHVFSPRLRGQFRGGVSFRSFDQGGSEVDPEVEGSLDYALGRHSSIGWTARYGVEQPTEQNSAGQVTFRTGVQFRYAFTARISSAVGFNYQHNDNQGGVSSTGSVQPTGASFATDAYDVLASLRYQINRRLDCDLGFQHSENASADAFQDYTRNRYSVGLNFTF